MASSLDEDMPPSVCMDVHACVSVFQGASAYMTVQDCMRASSVCTAWLDAMRDTTVMRGIYVAHRRAHAHAQAHMCSRERAALADGAFLRALQLLCRRLKLRDVVFSVHALECELRERATAAEAARQRARMRERLALRTAARLRDVHEQDIAMLLDT